MRYILLCAKKQELTTMVKAEEIFDEECLNLLINIRKGYVDAKNERELESFDRALSRLGIEL